MSKPLPPGPSPVDIIAKFHYINQNHQDAFFNLIAFSLQAASLVIKSGTNVNNATSIGLSNLGQSINSSRFILRFLSGVSSIHVILNHRAALVDFFKSFRVGSKKASDLGDIDGVDDDETTLTDDERAMKKTQATQERIQRIIQGLRLLQAFLTLANNVTEIPAYIASVAPMLCNFHGDWFGRLSCFCWLLNTLVEMVIVALLRYSREITASHFQVALTPLICDVFLSANWSLRPQKQFLSSAGLTTLGLISACVNFNTIWKNIKVDQQ